MQVRLKLMIGLLLFVVPWCPQDAGAQKVVPADTIIAATVVTAAPDSSVAAVMAAADSAVATIPAPVPEMPAFKPNPTKAVLFSAIFPGLGQIYNRKYWKLPIVYGGLMACTYAITWNGKNLRDYTQAYSDITIDPVNKTSWQNFLPIGADPATYMNDKNFHEQLKRKKDFFRRNRDLSIIVAAGVYLLCMVDAYVDAQLFDFDITPDLSMRVVPETENPTPYSKRTYGINCSIKF